MPTDNKRHFKPTTWLELIEEQQWKMENEKKGRRNNLKWEIVWQTHETIPSPKSNNNNSFKNKNKDEKNQSLKSTKNEKN